MRTSSILRHHAIFGIVMLIAACSKESGRYQRSTTEVQPQLSIVTLSLTASSWIHNSSDIYTNTFADILEPFNSGTSSVGDVKVYIGSYDVDIIRNLMTYEKGVLLAEVNLNDVIITYSSSIGRIPFRSLDITLVITRG